jgi:hypothetical protein
MIKKCPDYLEKMPVDKPVTYRAEAIVIYGYWGHKSAVVASKPIKGYLNAYKTARWLALKAQWFRPSWLTDCGISYRVKDI